MWTIERRIRKWLTSEWYRTVGMILDLDRTKWLAISILVSLKLWIEWHWRTRNKEEGHYILYLKWWNDMIGVFSLTTQDNSTELQTSLLFALATRHSTHLTRRSFPAPNSWIVSSPWARLLPSISKKNESFSSVHTAIGAGKRTGFLDPSYILASPSCGFSIHPTPAGLLFGPTIWIWFCS